MGPPHFSIYQISHKSSRRHPQPVLHAVTVNYAA